MSRPGVLVCGMPGVGRSTLAARLEREQVRPVIVFGDPAEEPAIEVLLRVGAECDCALTLVDARRGLDAETRQLSHLVSLLGLPHVAVVANKVELTEDGAGAFAELALDWADLAEGIGLTETVCLPVSALNGDNIGPGDPGVGWYEGMTLLGYLDGRGAPAGGGGEGGAGGGGESGVERADQIQATIVWGHEDPLLPGRSYRVRIGAQSVSATVAPLKYRINLDTLAHAAATKLERGQVGVCALQCDHAVSFTPYSRDRGQGGFVLADPLTGATVGIGLIHFALRRAHNLRWQRLSIDRDARAERKGQKPCVLWFTGLSGAGKSTIANRVELELHGRGRHTYMLDGDNVRQGLNRDLGFTDADRVENIRRVAEVARLMIDAGLIVLVSFISPFRSERQMARARFEPDEFLEIFVDTPLAVAEQRDPKGLYQKARRGELENFTGISSPYEPPERPELRLATAERSAEESAAAVIGLLEARNLLPPA